MKQILILSPFGPGTFCGVGDYSALLANHLSVWMKVSLITNENLWKSRRKPPLNEADGVLLQYVPQLYMKTEAFWLALWLFYFCVMRRKKLYVTVHEYAIPWDFKPKRLLGRMVMMLMMLVLGSFADGIVVTAEGRVRQIRQLLFWMKNAIHLLPVGTNIPKDNCETGAQAGDPLTLTLFGQPSGMDPRLLKTLKHWISLQTSIRTIWIGRSKQEILSAWSASGNNNATLEIQERVSVSKVSSLLRNTNIFVAPLADGVSTRRTTVIAALAHGLPVIGTKGECTDALLQNSPAFLLSEPGDGQALIRNLEALINDPDQRASMGQAAEDLFNKFFKWEVIAEQYRTIFALPESFKRTIPVTGKSVELRKAE